MIFVVLLNLFVPYKASMSYFQFEKSQRDVKRTTVDQQLLRQPWNQSLTFIERI